MASKKSRKDKFGWKLMNEFPITEYTCGLKAGDRVVLKKDLIIRDDGGNPTGKIHSKGEAWVVLPGSKLLPIAVWFQKSDGDRHTLNDDETVFEWIEFIGRKES
jgi:hypothetical protein